MSAPQERIGIISLGCSRNTVDSEKLLGQAVLAGAKISSLEKASTILVNTCAFTKDAKQESVDVILDLIELKKKGKIRKILVHGCLSERYPESLRKNFKEVDGFFGIAGFKDAAGSLARLTPKHYAYLKISEGCANRCSYCAIPNIKGPLRSRGADSIVEEARALEDAGVVELNIVGQDITLFGHDRPPAAGTKGPRALCAAPLTALLEKILRATRIPWIRLFYLHPRRVSDELLNLMAAEKRICPYLDVPLQHINDRILGLMDRSTSRKDIVSLIERSKKRVPAAALRTTFIVGFPSETQKEFLELLDFVREVRFDRLGAFAFSREEGTPAYSFGDQVPAGARRKRLDALMSLQREISRKGLGKRVGEVLEVMVDEEPAGPKDAYVGRTAQDAPEVDGVVYLTSKTRLTCGSFVKARVVDSYEYDLVAEVLP